MGDETGRIRISGPLDASRLPAVVCRCVERLPRDALAAKRWFGDKGRRIDKLSLVDVCVLNASLPAAVLCLVEVSSRDGPASLYQLPAVLGADARLNTRSRDLLAVRLESDDGEYWLRESEPQDPFWRELLLAFREGVGRCGQAGSFHFRAGAGFEALLAGHEPFVADAGGVIAVRALDAEQSNSSYVYDERCLYKVYRKVEPGIHPEIELGRYLTEQSAFRAFPEVAATLEYRGNDGSLLGLGVLQRFVRGSVDAWSRLAAGLRELARHREAAVVRDLPLRIGQMTGELHAALAGAEDASLRSEPFAEEDLQRLKEGVLEQAAEVVRALDENGTPYAGDLRAAIQDIIGRMDSRLAEGRRMRVHGDYHLGQVLCAESDVYVIDLEGEPARPLEERRRKQSPLKDVAGMLRSFSYAASLATREGDAGAVAPGEPAEGLREWEESARGGFLRRYRTVMENSPQGKECLPPPGPRERLLSLFELEKVLYEILYELRNRPGLLWVPLRGLDAVLDRSRGSA